jgi:alkyl hydroperoxide reductase subunit F
MELVEKFREQVLQFGIDFEIKALVKSIEDGDIKQVHLEEGRSYRTRTLIIASGKQYKKLGVPGEQALTGHGVAYCSICDAPLFVGKKVVVSGGGNSGVAAAIDLAKVADHVTLIQSRDHLTGDQLLIEKLQAFQNVDYLFEHIVTQIHGEKSVTGVTILNRKTGVSFDKTVDGIFVEIGLIPNSGLVQGILELNEYQEILVDCHCRTSAPGIFAAGDVTSVPFKQIIIACGEGAKAALSANEYIMNRAD